MTDVLGLKPSSSFEADKLISRGNPKPRGYSHWDLTNSDDIESGIELHEQIDKLLVRLEPVQDALWDLAREGYFANWSCVVYSNVCEPAVALDRLFLARLLKLPGDLWIDVAGDGSEDE